MNDHQVCVRIRGDFALFTRPESKTERVSYPVITPSAARGVLEAISWHPQFRWVVKEIHVLSEIKTMGILRNEVNSKIAPSRIDPYYADEDRTQRYSVCLRDVDYLIFADVELRKGCNDHPNKFREIFRRRVERGQCFHRPSLGCREFSAEFGLADGAPRPAANESFKDLGLMLWDMNYPEGFHDARGWHPKTKPPYPPMFFHAELKNGVLRIPSQPIGGHA
jgi:CRISPR-associated protein Cas5d